MLKKSLAFIVAFIIISGCSNITGEDVLLKNISTLEQSFDQEDWMYLKRQGEGLQTLYEENKWKIQLLGDEGEYEGLNESINRLIVTLEERDVTQAKLELSTIKSLIKDIYSM